LGVREAQQQKTDVARERQLKLALGELFKRSDPNVQRLAQEETGLLLMQKDLEIGSGEKYVGLSLSETLSKIIGMRQLARAEKLKTEFQVPPKRFAWIAVRALAKSNQWDELRTMSKVKELVLPLSAFVQVCADNGNKTEALAYIGRMRENSERAVAFARSEMWVEAIQAAMQSRDKEEMLLKLRSICRSPDVLAEINKLIIQSRE